MILSFSKVPPKLRTQSFCANSLFILFWNVRIFLIKWAIILEFGKRLFYLASKTTCVPCYLNENDRTSYEGPPKFNSFRRYFNQIYSDKMLNKLIITLAEKSLFSILAECVTWLKCWKFSKKLSWRFHCESSDKSIIYWFFQQITQSFW